MTKKNLAAIVAAAALIAGTAAAQEAAARKAGVAAQKASITATVTKIDSANRVLTLKGPNGKSVDVEVSTAVKRFPEIKVGDQLNVDYTEALIVSVARMDSSVALGTSVEQTLEPKAGEKPAGLVTRTIKATVGVDSIDTARSEMTVHASDGSTQTFHIQDLKNVEGVKPGDKITVVYQEAVALAVTSPAPKS
jgi:Cu/Ag efflux protein CusF